MDGKIVRKMFSYKMSTPQIHSTAIVHPHAKLGDNVTVGAFSIVHDNVIIGENSQIGSYCEIGVKAADSRHSGQLSIGPGAIIRSHSVFYEGSNFESGLTTGHRVTVRERTNAGKHLQIGTLSDIQGHCSIGKFVRLHSNVHVGQRSKIGDYVWIFPYVVLTNDPTPPSNHLVGVTIEKYAAVATMSVILPGVTIGEGALVGAVSSVTKDVKSNTVVIGVPAKEVGPTSKITLKDGSGMPAYPWRRHFHRGYDHETVAQWLEEFGGLSSK